MNPELLSLCMVSASVALLHTLTGPDHYLPFIAIGRAKSWSLPRTLGLTAVCGLGHVGSSIVLGLVGVAFGLSIFKLSATESSRGQVAAWLLFIFGCTYTVVALWRMLRSRTHTHSHIHSDGTRHTHSHSHVAGHTHAHGDGKITPMGPLHHLRVRPLRAPDSHRDGAGRTSKPRQLILVTTIFALVTIGTMLVLVSSLSAGLRVLPARWLHRWGQVLAGVTLSVCGGGMLFLGW